MNPNVVPIPSVTPPSTYVYLTHIGASSNDERIIALAIGLIIVGLALAAFWQWARRTWLRLR